MDVGAVVMPDGRVGVSARVGNVVIGGVSKTVDVTNTSDQQDEEEK